MGSLDASSILPAGRQVYRFVTGFLKMKTQN